MNKTSTPKIILGIDPGLHNTGWGTIVQNGNSLKFMASGTITTSPKDEMLHRLKEISDGLAAVIKNSQPNESAIEEVFVNKNNLSSLKLGHARGAIMLTVAQQNLNCAEYSATNVKKTIVGKGRAEKQQVEMMIKILLPKATPKNDHEADALAIAVTHANTVNGLY